MKERDEGDRVRRLSSIMRFVAQMRECRTERDLVGSLIQAGAVWYDLDARAYRRDLSGRFLLEAWLPGSDVANDPQTLDIGGLLTPDGPTHLSSIVDLEQLGWRSLQGEVLLLPIVADGLVRWVMAVAGTVERDIETMLLLVCRSAGAAIERLSSAKALETEQCLVRRITEGSEPFQARARGVLEEYADSVGAAGARLSVRAGAGRALTVASIGDQWSGLLAPILEGGAAVTAPGALTFGLPLANAAVAIVELAAAPGVPFTVAQAQIARVGGEVLGIWLSGVSGGAGLSLMAGREAPAPEPPRFEHEMQAELERARRLRLSGGLLVASVPGSGMPEPRVLSVIIQVVRGELRSSDLLGQLAGGDIAAVLVRTSADGVARAAERVRRRLDLLACEHRLPAVVIGHALYPGGTAESPAALVTKARQEAGLMFS